MIRTYVLGVCIRLAKAFKGVFEMNEVFTVVEIVESKAAGLRMKRLQVRRRCRTLERGRGSAKKSRRSLGRADVQRRGRWETLRDNSQGTQSPRGKQVLIEPLL